MIKWGARFIFWQVFTVVAALALFIVLGGCSSLPPVTSMSDDWCAKHPNAGPKRCTKSTETDFNGDKVYSWDQENLKRNDHGCPTAIYVAPGGKLQQC